MDVSVNTLRRAFHLVADLCELDDVAEFAGLALPGLAGLVGCEFVTYNELNPASGEIRYREYPAGCLDPGVRAVFAAHLHEHPLINHHVATGDREAVKISDFLTQQQFHRLGLYGECFRLIRVEHEIAFSLAGPGTDLIGIAFNRSRGDFTETERAMLNLIRASLARALTRAHARQQANAALTATSGEQAALTDREIQVLQLVAMGRTNAAIGHALDVSPRTVAKHLEHAYRKLGVASRAAAVARTAGTMPP